jgi:beta-N-acetylhexosaminidase
MLSEKIENAVIFGCEGPYLKEVEFNFFAETSPFGFILFSRNIVNAKQVKKLCSSLRNSVGWHAPILIDQEGGRVQRVRAPLALDWLPPLDEARKAGQNAESIFKFRFSEIARELSLLGIDFNCAPVLDIARATTHKFLQNRCYGVNKFQVISLGKIVYEALKLNGVFPIIKHMPGHGFATHDSHFELPVVKASKKELFENDFAVFKAFSNAEIAMSAHVLFEAVDPHTAASTSKKMMEIIRNEINFSGLLLTDDISMSALRGDIKKRTNNLIEAGNDVILHCNGNLTEMKEIINSDVVPNAMTLSRMASVIEERKKIEHNRA